MAVKKLSEIVLAGSPPALTDTVVGVGGGTTDLQYTLAQVQTTMGGGSGVALKVGSTTVASGTSGYALTDNAGVLGNAPIRTILTANTNYYVRTDGSDSNTGIANTAGGAWATLQHAYNVFAASLDTAGFSVTINVADGTYAAGINAQTSWVGGGQLFVTGNITTPSNCIISGGVGVAIFIFNIVAPAPITIGGFKVESTDPNSTLVNAPNTGLLNINEMEYGQAGFAQISCGSPGAFIGINTVNYTISGGAQIHAYCAFFGLFFNTANNITLTGTPAFSFFAFVEHAGDMEWEQVGIFIGTGTGTGFFVANVSVLDTSGATGGGDINYFPVSPGGFVKTGAVYI